MVVRFGWMKQGKDEALADLSLSHSRLKALRDYWLDLSKDGEVSQWSDFDFVHLPDLVPHFVLVDVFSDPLRFQYRFLGSVITAMAGRDATTAWLDEELYPTNLETIEWAYRYVVLNREPVATIGPVEFVEKGWHTLEYIYLPFAGHDNEVTKVLCCWIAIEGRSTQDERIILDWQAD